MRVLLTRLNEDPNKMSRANQHLTTTTIELTPDDVTHIGRIKDLLAARTPWRASTQIGAIRFALQLAADVLATGEVPADVADLSAKK